MSLFKARNWWSHTIGTEGIFDQGHLCVANIDNSSQKLDKVIVGGFNGVLRIYKPRETREESSSADDVLLEMMLPQPILQVETGRFVSISKNLHLAVLHPRKLAVYGVSGTTGAVEHGSQYQMKLMYEHNLQRTAYNLTVGPFGSVKGKDFLCVQSMDGALSFFEQESFAFSRFLPGFLLPGPIKYVPRTDSFITASSGWHAECYKYKVLAVATDVANKEESSHAVTSGKKITADWAFSLGEAALDLVVISEQGGAIFVVILGERSVVCLKDTGVAKFMKKLDYNPSCFYPYGIASETGIRYMIATHTGQLMIYEDSTLKWTAKLEHVPVAIRVGAFQDLKGVVVSLDDQGHLACSYLGTDPSLFVTPSIDSREINYEEHDNEMMKLKRIIKDSSGKQDVLSKNAAVDGSLNIEVSVPQSLDTISNATETEVEDDEPIPSISVKLVLKSNIGLSNVRLLIHCPYPLSVTQSTFTFASVGDSSAAPSIVISFFLRGNSLPSSLTATAVAMYLTSKGAPRVIQQPIQLPLKLVVKPCAPIKNATYKVTIDSNRNAAHLNELFPDLLGCNAGGPGQALGFQLIGGPKVTILASKSSQRYRLQSDVFESMWLVMQSFMERLRAYQQRNGAKDFELSYTGVIPLAEYCELVDTHLELRINADRYKELLDQRAHQFRAIQRRLLTRFKDKTPSPLANLDTLLDGTYRQILKLADGIEENRKALVRCSLGLSCATHMVLAFIRLANRLDDREFEILGSSLIPQVPCDEEQGWEEAVDAGVCNLLRTYLARKSPDQSFNPVPLKMPSDATKLRKHITQMCDRLGKGIRLTADGQTPKEATNEGLQSSTNPAPSTLRAVPEETSSDEQSERLASSRQPLPNESNPVLTATRPPPHDNGHPGIDGLSTPLIDGNNKEVATPGDPPMGELPSLGGPGVRGTTLPPLGGLGPESPSGLPELKPIKRKKKKKKTTKPSQNHEGPDLGMEDGFYGETGSEVVPV